MKSYRCSVIIPIYNAEKHIKRCVKSLQECNKEHDIEILLINDGSTDRSRYLCNLLAARYNNVYCYHQENAGVSAARNVGIRHARGKYLFYLDADDELKEGTIQSVLDFFDSVYDKTDLVTYPIETIYRGKKATPHFRYQYLKESGVYDLREQPYIGQTTMNIVVKNKFEKNVLFDENQSFSEDQVYCCEVLKEKLKMGFCKDGAYIYYRNSNSSSGRLAGACYIFEQCTSFFERMFAWYEEDVPKAFQGLFVNDFAWKLACNILLPYHYEREQYDQAVDRLRKLLRRCSNDVILCHPQIDFFEKFYMLRLKGQEQLSCIVNPSGFGLWDREICAVYESVPEIVVTKCQIRKGKVLLCGFLKSVFYQFYDREPILCAIENPGTLKKNLSLQPSAHEYYLSHEKTQKYWAFFYEADAEKVAEVTFKVGIDGFWFPVKYYFMPWIPFSHDEKRYEYTNQGIQLNIDEANHIHIQKVLEEQKESVWLYYDCAGVERDNGMLQFLHDYKKNDGVTRYYVVSDERQRAYLPNEKCSILWGSDQHKKIFLQCQKIITAFIENENIIPFPRSEYDKFAGSFQFEIVYLQHGVLHIDMPWKYSPEHILADKVVVSTKQEAELYKSNGFRDEDLLKYRMPRFENKIRRKEACKKLLFAPSWRSYLVGNYENRQWEKLTSKFKTSSYFKNIQEFLNSEKLEQFLEKYDYTLEVKLHPIFSMYAECFQLNSAHIKMVDTVDAVENYAICITDISSLLYDYLFQEIPVFLFLPDVVEFKAGMNGYRDIKDPEYWEKVNVSADELIEKLIRYVVDKVYDEIECDFYLCDSPTEMIYQAVFDD